MTKRRGLLERIEQTAPAARSRDPLATVSLGGRDVLPIEFNRRNVVRFELLRAVLAVRQDLDASGRLQAHGRPSLAFVRLRPAVAILTLHRAPPPTTSRASGSHKERHAGAFSCALVSTDGERLVTRVGTGCPARPRYYRATAGTNLGWDAAPSRSGAGARTASEKRPSARNGSLPPPIKGAAAADSGADNPVRLLPAFLPARESGSLSLSGGKTTGTRSCPQSSRRSSGGPCVRRDVTANSCENGPAE